jgi:hypothetical protein
MVGVGSTQKSSLLWWSYLDLVTGQEIKVKLGENILEFYLKIFNLLPCQYQEIRVILGQY